MAEILKRGDHCQKCTAGHIKTGPTYVVRNGQELLAYACDRCGFQIFEPCVDANPKDPRLRKTNAATQS